MIKQGSAVMRIVAIAVSIAILLGMASVMFQITASAESVESVDDTVASLGTIGNYRSIKFTAGQKLDVEFLYSAYSSSTSTNLFGCVFGYKNGKFVSFTNNNFSIRPDSSGQYHFIYFCGSQFAYEWIPDSFESAYFQFGFYNNNYCNSCIRIKNGEPSMGGSSIIGDKNVSFTDTYGDTMYIVFTAVEGSWSTTDRNNFTDDVINNYKDSDYKDSSISTPSAEFVSCKSAPTGYPEGVLWFEDWIKEGMQYPYFSWYIRDNGNHHSYSVKFSYNSSQVDTCEKVFNNRFYDELENVKQNPLLLFAESGIIFAASKLKWLAEQVGLLKNITAIQWKNLSYTDSFVLKSDDMDFTTCDNSGNRVFSVCLSDYSDIGRYFIYRADIIDNVTGQVLDTTFFCPLNKFNKGNSGYGSKIYDYGDNGDGMLDDLINNTPSVDPSIKNPFDISGDVIDNNYGGGSLSDLNISDIASSLESSVNSVSVFFRFCWTLFPSAIWSLILLGLSLIIILRVLGR